MRTSSAQPIFTCASYREGGTLLGRFRFFAGAGAGLFQTQQHEGSTDSPG
jgi:hypothetical protein